MRVLHLTTSFPKNLGDWSGLFVYHLVRALEKEGVTCNVLTPAGRQRSFWPGGDGVCRFSYAPRSWQRFAQMGGIPQTLTQHPLLHILLPCFALSMVAHLLFLARHCDLIHAHWSVCGGLAVLTQPFHGKPVITTLRGSDTHLAKTRGLYAGIHRCAIAGSRFTVGVSQQIVAGLKQRHPTVADRFAFVANGVDEHFYAISPSNRPRKPPVKFIFIGSLIPIKGVDTLLNAFASLDGSQDWMLTIAGDGPEMDSLVRLAQVHRLSDRISFLGGVSPSRVASLLCDHHVLILPSRREGRPNVVLEAMAAALPVIGTDVDGTRELVQHNLTGWLVPPRSPAALADMISSVLRGEKELLVAGMAGRRWMFEHDLDWATAARHYLDLYNEAIMTQSILG